MPTRTGAKKGVGQLKKQLLTNNDDDYTHTTTIQGERRTTKGKGCSGKGCAGRGRVFWGAVLGTVVLLVILIIVAAVEIKKHVDAKALANQACFVNACSESQGNSNNDAGTNMCNMMNLFCNSATKNMGENIACSPVKHNLTYNVEYLECGRYQRNGDTDDYYQHDCQPFTTQCLLQPSMTPTALAKLEQQRRIEAMLGAAAPKDYAHEDFLKISTCPGSGASTHTMAQMTAKFDGNCDNVAQEILARANGNDGWQDPHNRGTYTNIQSTDPTFLILKRVTGNKRYTDKMTFSLTSTTKDCTYDANRQSCTK